MGVSWAPTVQSPAYCGHVWGPPTSPHPLFRDSPLTQNHVLQMTRWNLKRETESKSRKHAPLGSPEPCNTRALGCALCLAVEKTDGEINVTWRVKPEPGLGPGLWVPHPVPCPSSPTRASPSLDPQISRCLLG